MHDDGCFTGCAPIFTFFLFFFWMWATIESNIHERLLYQSQKYETYEIDTISDSLHQQQIEIDGRYHSSLVRIWYFTVNDSTQFWRNQKDYNIGDNVKRFYYTDHKKQKVYSDFYSYEKDVYEKSTFWESIIFILYAFVFTVLTIMMYIKYYKFVEEKFTSRLKSIDNANLLDRVFIYLTLNKVIILTSMLSVYLLINTLGFYFIKVPETSINPGHAIFLFFILTFLIPVTFIQILRKKDNPIYRNLLNIIGISIITISIVSFLFALIEFQIVGSLEKTTLLNSVIKTWEILKDLLSG